MTTKITRAAVAKSASNLGYELSSATSSDRMEAANLGESTPRWTLTPTGGCWASQVQRFETLEDVADGLDRLEVDAR